MNKTSYSSIRSSRCPISI